MLTAAIFDPSTLSGNPSAQTAGHSCTRVALARVGGKLIAVSEPAAGLTLLPVSGVLDNAKRGRARVSTVLSEEQVDLKILIAGCDPAISILTAWLGRQRLGVNTVGLSCSSRKALAADADGYVHTAAGDPSEGTFPGMLSAAFGTGEPVQL